jgi:hypothetical protein
MTRHRPIINGSRTFTDRDHVRDLTMVTTFLSCLFGPAYRALRSKVPKQLFLKHTAGLNKQTAEKDEFIQLAIFGNEVAQLFHNFQRLFQIQEISTLCDYDTLIVLGSFERHISAFWSNANEYYHLTVLLRSYGGQAPKFERIHQFSQSHKMARHS